MHPALTTLTACALLGLAACSGESDDAPAPDSTSAAHQPAAPNQAKPKPDPEPGSQKRNRPGEPGFDTTKAVWPPLVPPLPADGPKTITIRIDRATQHGLHTTVDLSIHGPLDDIGDFSFSLLFKDADNRGLSLKRVMVPNGATMRQFTLMGVNAVKIDSIEVDFHDAMTSDGYYLDQLPQRYTLAIDDRR